MGISDVVGVPGTSPERSQCSVSKQPSVIPPLPVGSVLRGSVHSTYQVVDVQVGVVDRDVGVQFAADFALNPVIVGAVRREEVQLQTRVAA